MSRSKQPYLPLFVNDFLSDEKLKEVGPASIGIYIYILCILHKQKEYGKLILEDKHKINDDPIINFSTLINKSCHFNINEIEAGLIELVNEKIIRIEFNALIQDRMVRDNELSIIRSNAAKSGFKGIKTVPGFEFTKNHAKAVEHLEFTPSIATEAIEKYTKQTAWIESIAMQMRIDASIIINKLKEFIQDQNNKGTLKEKSDADFKTHFINWIKKQPKEEKKQVTRLKA